MSFLNKKSFIELTWSSIPTGLPPIINPTSAPSQTSFVYTLPARSYSHIVVFILPGVTLPPNTAAAVYIAVPSSSTPANLSFKFLGAVGPGKESAIFKVNGLIGNSSNGNAINTSNGEVDMDVEEDQSEIGEVTLGISLETAESVAAQMATLSNTSKTSSDGNSQALVLASRVGAGKPDTLLLAQRIIKNAFNFLASFSGNVNGGIEVVPLRAFEEWWKKFESRVRSDPTFLEKESD